MCPDIGNRPVWLILRLLGHQDWIRYGVRERLLRHFCNPNIIDSYEFEVAFFGSKYRGNLNCYLDWCVYFYGAYEKQELFLMRDLIKNRPNSVFVDIGANVGQHSLFMSKYCEQVHSFEPYESIRSHLEDKISYNNCENVVIHNVGLGYKDEELDFSAPKGTNTGTGSFIPSHATDNNTRIGKLKVVNGDMYLSLLGLKSIDLIKIDVEGFEKHVLMGLRNTLDHYRPKVLMEFSETTKDSFTGLDELNSMLPKDYRIKRVIPNRKYLLFFNRPQYRLIDFDFNVPEGNLLFSPED